MLEVVTSGLLKQAVGIGMQKEDRPLEDAFYCGCIKQNKIHETLEGFLRAYFADEAEILE